MLVVTRKKDEKLIIGNEIEIQVLRIGRDNVRLGIKAPAHISIYRNEIYEAYKSYDRGDVNKPSWSSGQKPSRGFARRPSWATPTPCGYWPCCSIAAVR